MNSYRLANMTRREENVAASSFRAFSSFRSFIMVSDTMLFSVSYLVFRLDRASSAVYVETQTQTMPFSGRMFTVHTPQRKTSMKLKKKKSVHK